jgi:hypothetical protein
MELKELTETLLEGMEALETIIASADEDPHAMQFLTEIAPALQIFVQSISELTRTQIQ